MTVWDGREIRSYPAPDVRGTGMVGYLCHCCRREEIVPRFSLPTVGFELANMVSGADPRVVWVCSRSCLVQHAATL